jgi:hypothetical protein
MNKPDKKCACGWLLVMSKYASDKPEGASAARGEDNLVCSNPDCPKSEKELIH